MLCLGHKVFAVCFHQHHILAYCIAQYAIYCVCSVTKAILRLNHLTVLGNFALNVIGAVWVFDMSVSSTRVCAQTLHITVFVYIIAWLCSVVFMPFTVFLLAKRVESV